MFSKGNAYFTTKFNDMIAKNILFVVYATDMKFEDLTNHFFEFR